MSAALEPRGATSRWRRSKRDKGAPKNPPASRDAAPDGPSEAHRTDATGDLAHPRARRGREAPSDDPAEARLDGTEPFANDDSPEGSPAGPLSASELTASSCSGGSCASEDGDGSAAADVGATENARREDAPEEANRDERAVSEVGSEPLVETASPEDEWPAVGLGARERDRDRGDARAPAAAAKWRCAGDWPCGACAHANSGWRARCARCGAEKEKNGRSRAPAGSNLSADGAVGADGAAFPPLGAATTDGQGQAANRLAGVRPETTSDPDATERDAAAAFFHDAASLAGASTGAFAGAPPDAIPLEALERAFAETAAETAAETKKEKGASEFRDASRQKRTTRAQTTKTPFRWDDEEEEKKDAPPLPPLPWGPWGARADAVGNDGDAWTPAPDPRVTRMDPSPDACRITTVDEGSQYPVIDALREALRLERDARDAAVRAGIAVAREADFDALRETAETVASHFSARVALDVEARIAADAEDAKKRHADLERRLAEVTSENGRNKARNASLASLAERLERRLDATSARCVALEGETARLASLVDSLLVSSRLVETSVQTTRVEEDTHATATAQNSKRGETLSNERFPRRAINNVARRPAAFLHEDAENVFVRREEKASALDGAGLVKRARSEAADDDHGTYLEAQPLGGFGSSASVFGAESETAKPRNGADGDADDVVAVSRTTESFSSESKTTAERETAKPSTREETERRRTTRRETSS